MKFVRVVGQGLVMGLGFGLCVGQCQVILNEFVAVASDRLLQRSAGKYPRVGTTTPWQAASYDDSQWFSGPGPFGFGSFSGVTLGTDVAGRLQNRAASLYLRRTFNVTPTQAASGATLQLLTRYNDGFIAFLNGTEVARRNMGNPGMFAFHDQTAFNTNVNNPGWETINLGAANTRLVVGENVLCLQAHNQSLTGPAGANFLILADLRILEGDTLVDHTGSWRYFPGLSEPSGGVLDYELYRAFLEAGAGVAWGAVTFNDATWPVGPGPVGIEGVNPPDYLLGVNLYAQAYNVTPSIYTRQVFTITPAEAASASPLRLTIDYDDGLIVYLNGKEMARRNVGTPGVPTPHSAFAWSGHNANGDGGGTVSGQQELLLLGAPQEVLRPGVNVLSVQLHRASLTSSDAIARVTLETTGSGGRVLCQPTDTVSYFLGVQEPVVAEQQEDWGPLEEPPDLANDWVELHNTGAAEVNLAGWSLTDNPGSLRKWMFPTNIVIPAGGYVLVLATGLDTSPAAGASHLHSNFKLSEAGEYLGLVNATGAVVDHLSPAFPPQSYFHSYGRDTNGQWGYLSQVTPGAPNLGQGLAPAPAAPAFSVAGGFHNSGFSLILTSATPGSIIAYTLDGSEPKPGLLYVGPLSIRSNRIVRARALKPGSIPSPTITHTYLINQSAARRALPALCLGGDPTLTFYGPNTSGGPANGEGILAIKGGIYLDDVWTHNNDPAAFHFPMQRGRATEKPATLEFFPLSGPALRTDLGLRLAGSGWSRPRYRLTDAPTAIFSPWDETRKPSFNLYFRPEWSERPLEYPFFGNLTVDRFQDVRLRAGKNDIATPFVKDEFLRRIYVGTGQKGSVGIFNTVYLNGVFKGYFNLCERLREGFMQAHHDSSEAWDVQQVNEFTSGDPLNWNKMFAYLRSTNLATLNGYLGTHAYLDVDNLIDYLAVNAFAAMWDWPNNNWVAARERSPQGRWRFYLWDAEGGFGLYGRDISHNTFMADLIISDAQTTTWNYLPALYTLLRVSPEFRLRFADRVQRHFFNGGCLVKTNLQAVFLQLRDTINPIMQETIGMTVDESFYQTWIVNDTRRNTFFSQLTGQSLWPAVQAPLFSHYGGRVASAFQLTLTNPNGSGTMYYTTNGADPRAPGGGLAGLVYTTPILVNQTATIKARVRSTGGVWSPVIEADFVLPPDSPTFLPGGSGDWTTNLNWSSAPAPYPDGVGGGAIIPPPASADRNVNLRAPVTIGSMYFPQDTSAVRNRVRDQGAGNTLTFHNTNGPAHLEVGGRGEGYVEFEVLAGTTLQSDLRLHTTNLVGHPEHGALRLRANWTGPGGLIKSGAGVVSLTGDAKTYTGATVIEEGVLQITQPATPSHSATITVQTGGQLRLISANDDNGARIYNFGGPLILAGAGRGPEIPEESNLGKLGALRYDPGLNDNHAIVLNPIQLSSPTDIHVDGTLNRLELAGSLTGPHALNKSGGGILLLTANNAGHTAPMLVDNGTLALAGALGSPVTVGLTATLTGHGQAGALTGHGALLLDQTLLRAPSDTGLTHLCVFGQTGSPVFNAPAAAGNGVLALSNAPAAVERLDLYLSLPHLALGSTLRGGFFVPFTVDLAGALANTPWRAFVPDANGSHDFAGQTWSPLSQAQLTTVPVTADFGEGGVAGRIMEIRHGGEPARYGVWQTNAFPNPADLANPLVSGPYADPQGTGTPNLLRYALGLALTDPPATRAPQFSGTATTPGLRFPFDAGRNDIVYVVEANSSLTNWSAAKILFDSRTDFPPPNTAGWITVLDPAPTGNQRFYRLRVILISAP